MYGDRPMKSSQSQVPEEAFDWASTPVAVVEGGWRGEGAHSTDCNDSRERWFKYSPPERGEVHSVMCQDERLADSCCPV